MTPSDAPGPPSLDQAQAHSFPGNLLRDAGVHQVIVAADPATTFANLFVRYQWKVARLVEVLDRVPFQQCLVFLNHRAR